MVIIYKFCKKIFWTYHQENLKNITQVKFDKKVCATKNFIKTKITGRVDILCRNFVNKKFKSNHQENLENFI